jgi:hypothetical protein
MAEYGLKRLIIRTNWENLEWVIHSFVGTNYPSLQEFGLCGAPEEEDDFATYVQNGDAEGGIAFLKRVLEKNAQTEWLPSFWHIQETFTHTKGKQYHSGSFVIETYNERVHLVISYHHGSFWVDVRYDDPTLTHIPGYTEHIHDNGMKVWCVVDTPDGSERGLPLEDLPAMVGHWDEGHLMPTPKEYPFAGEGLVIVDTWRGGCGLREM